MVKRELLRGIPTTDESTPTNINEDLTLVGLLGLLWKKFYLHLHFSLARLLPRKTFCGHENHGQNREIHGTIERMKCNFLFLTLLLTLALPAQGTGDNCRWQEERALLNCSSISINYTDSTKINSTSRPTINLTYILLRKFMGNVSLVFLVEVQ